MATRRQASPSEAPIPDMPPPGPEAEEPGRRMRDRARGLGETIDAIGARGFDRVADVLENAGDAIGERAGDSPAARAVAEPLKRAGRYVGGSTPSSALADLDRAVERHPYRSLAVGVAAGWALGRLTRRLRAG